MTLAWMVYEGIGATADPERSFRILEKSCGAPYAPSCMRLAEALLQGRGVPRDLPRARALFRKACDEDDARGCTGWGLVEALDTEPGLAVTPLTRGCTGGDPAGCSALASLYELGRGVTQDRARARALYARACSDGDPSACGSLQRLTDKP
jgi:hypothetical protein